MTKDQINSTKKKKTNTKLAGESGNLGGVVEGDGAGEEGEDVLLGEERGGVGGGELADEGVVVGGQLRLPDGVGRGGAAEGAVEAGEVADLRRGQVHEDAGHAALRYIP